MSYNDKRWLEETKIYINDRYRCSLVYDRMPDGTVKRTLANGPDGELWAEYPDLSVTDVERDGQNIGGKSAILHKKGNWW